MGRTVLIDMRSTLVRPTGVGHAFRELTRALVAADRDTRFLLFSNSRRDRFPAADYTGSNVSVVDRAIPHRILSALWGRFRWPPLEALAGPCDVAHAPEPLPLPVKRARTVATLCDLFFLRHPELTDPAQTAHLCAGVRKLLPKADHVMAISEHVKSEAIAELHLDPTRITAVPLGLTPAQLRLATAEETRELRKRLRLPTHFLLYVGTIEPRKNVRRLIEAFAHLRGEKRHCGAKLLIAGQRGFRHEEEIKAIADFNITTEVRILDYLEGNDIKNLIHLARALVLPSRDEGFGLPVIEAMAQGTPVACSRRGALPEVAGDAAELFDPDDLHETMNALARVLGEEGRRKELASKGLERARQFTWEAAAAKVLGIYASLR